jgi:protein-disulfide isomerase
MSSNRPSGRPSSGNVPPTSRRSARQQRLANREANRSLSRAGTHGSSGSSNSLILYSVIAVLLGALVIVAALWLTSGTGSKNTGALGSPIAPQGSQITTPAIATNGRTLGSSDAKVTMDLWEDFQCPNCWNFTHDTESQVVANYVASGKVKVVYHDYLVIDGNTGGHESLDAANAALCASDQGKFWPYHDWLFANQYTEGSGAFTKDRLKAIGHAMGGLDNTKFDSCVDSGSHNADVQAEQKQIPAGSQGTPTVVVNGTLLASFDYATISAALDKALGVAPSPSPSASASATAAPTSTPTAAPSVTAAPSPSAS